VNVQVYIRIFISPSAVTGAKDSIRRGNAKIHGMEKVLPSTICYAAIQVFAGQPSPTFMSNVPYLLGIRSVVLQQGMEGGVEGRQVHMPLCSPSWALCASG